jgi:hypothetical protein
MHRIDLVEAPDRLDRDDLVNVRASLRLAQNEQGRRSDDSMLIFLDRNNMMFERVHSRRFGWRSDGLEHR